MTEKLQKLNDAEKKAYEALSKILDSEKPKKADVDVAKAAYEDARAAREAEEEIENDAKKNLNKDKDEAKKLDNKEPDKKTLKNKFINAVIYAAKNRIFKPEDKTYFNDTVPGMSEGSDADGGLTVPNDIRTEIMALTRSQDDLQQLVNVEPVTGDKGQRNIEVNADSTPYDNVDEDADFPDADTPKIIPVNYRIHKKGGIHLLSYELLKDTAENIMAFLERHIAKKIKVTRNMSILKTIDDYVNGLETTTPGTIKSIGDLDDIADIVDLDLDPGITGVQIITNQSGFNYLRKLKDAEGHRYMQPDPTKAVSGILDGEYSVVKLSNKTLVNDATKGFPCYIGNLKAAVTLFDRENMTIEPNSVGITWAKDQTAVKVRDRFDTQMVDNASVVKAFIKKPAAAASSN